METLTASDLALFLKAQALMQFVSNHLAEVYRLTQQDQINFQTGAIIPAPVV